MTNLSAQVHRFRDSVAIHVGNGETVYLTPAMARILSRALLKAAQSVKREKFTDSPSGLTVSVDIGDQTKICNATIKRV